jgi:hypothetical protein
MRRPSIRTVQAPHWPWSRPFFVPLAPRVRAGRRAGSRAVQLEVMFSVVHMKSQWDPGRLSRLRRFWLGFPRQSKAGDAPCGRYPATPPAARCRKSRRDGSLASGSDARFASASRRRLGSGLRSMLIAWISVGSSAPRVKKYRQRCGILSKSDAAREPPSLA